MKRDRVRILKGLICSFDGTTAQGVVRITGGGTHTFHSTCFNSGTPVRFPLQGEAVEIVLGGDQNQLLRVRVAERPPTKTSVPKGTLVRGSARRAT